MARHGLYDADTADRLCVASGEQIAYSDASDDQGELGFFLVSDEGAPVDVGSWDAQQAGVRTVYTLAEVA